MSKSRWIVAGVILFTTVACGSGMSAEEEFAQKQAADGLAEIKADLANGEDPKYNCAASQSYASKLTTDEGKAIAAELEQVCGFDTPLLSATQAVEKAEKARKANPDKNPLSECYSAYYKSGMETLNEKGHGDKPDVQKLSKRWDKVCPPKS